MNTTKKILVIEDDVEVNNLIVACFKKHGFIVDNAYTFSDARQLLEKEQYDLITLDWNLDSGKTGFDLLTSVHDSTKVLLASGHAVCELHEASRKYPRIHGYVQKAFTEIELITTGRALLEM